MSRRGAMALISLIAVFVIIVFAATRKPSFESFEVGGAVHSVSWANNIPTTPDGGITFLDGRYYLAQATHGLVYDRGNWNEVSRPSGQSGTYNSDYEAPGAVIKVEDMYIMYTHAEQHNCVGIFPYRASIGMRISYDGLNFRSVGQVMDSWEEDPGCSTNRPSGVGYPSVVVNGDYAYMFFVGWYPDSADGVYVARCELSNIQSPDCWKNYHEGEWNEPGMNGRSTQVIGRSSEEELYLATPQVQLINGQFRGVFETNIGFVTATSEDAVTWTNREVVFEFPVPHISASEAQWYSYPSLLNTEDGWYLYFAQKDASNDHYMRRIAVNWQ